LGDEGEASDESVAADADAAGDGEVGLGRPRSAQSDDGGADGPAAAAMDARTAGVRKDAKPPAEPDSVSAARSGPSMSVTSGRQTCALARRRQRPDATPGAPATAAEERPLPPWRRGLASVHGAAGRGAGRGAQWLGCVQMEPSASDCASGDIVVGAHGVTRAAAAAAASALALAIDAADGLNDGARILNGSHGR
jgi:hypothetical protein